MVLGPPHGGHMEGELFSVPLRYQTLPAYESHVDAAELGRSLQGVGRLTNIVIHTIYTGAVPKRRTALHVRFFVGPPEKGSICFDLSAALGAAQLPFWWDTFRQVAGPLFEYFLAAILSNKLGRKDEKERALDIIQDLVARDDAYRTLVHWDICAIRDGFRGTSMS
jgi:hypothetical protein